MSKSFWMKKQSANFSNQKEDTFDPQNHFVGIRLQQGVPLLDRDWNELEDIRRYEETMLRKWYIGNGIPAGKPESFSIGPTDPPANDFTIETGRCVVDGFEVVNESALKYSDQKDVPSLNTPSAQRNDIVYLDVWIEEVTADTQDPEVKPYLDNRQDVGKETCIRHRLCWCVRVKEGGGTYQKKAYHHYYTLAQITREAGVSQIAEGQITDLRLVGLTLQKLVDNSMADNKHLHSKLVGSDGTPDPALSVDNSGKVGIGTTEPEAAFDLKTSAHPIARFSSSGSGNTWLRIENANAGMHLGVGHTTKHPYIWSHSNAFFIGNDGNPTIYVEGMHNGRLGICTVDPQYALDIRRIGDFIARFGNDNGSDLTIDVAGGQGLANIVAGAKVSGDGYVFTGNRGASRIRLHDGCLQLLTSTTPGGTPDAAVNWNRGLFIDNEGKVGIDAVQPQYVLDVRRIGDFIARFGNNVGSDLTIDVAGGQGLANIVAGAKVSGDGYVFTGTRGASRVRLHDGSLQLMTSTVVTGTEGSPVIWKTGLLINNDGNVGIGTSNPSAPLHVAGYMAVGPFSATTGQGGIDVAGPVAEFGFVRRSLTSWPRIPAAGDRFVWYNPDGTARLWTNQQGDVLKIYSDGSIQLYGGINGPDRDYAEYFESVDGEKIQPGTSVILQEGKVRVAMKKEIPSGVISVNPGMRGGVYSEWPRKYLKDEFGNRIMEEYKEEIMVPKRKKITRERQKVRRKKVKEKVSRQEIIYKRGKYCQKKTTDTVVNTVEEPIFKEVDLYDASGKTIIGKHRIPVMEKYKEEVDVLDDNGQPVRVGTGKFATRKRPKINPKYDKSKKYVPREKRPEWNCVGLLGQIPLRRGQPVAPTWVKVKNISKEVELWLIK